MFIILIHKLGFLLIKITVGGFPDIDSWTLAPLYLKH